VPELLEWLAARASTLRDTGELVRRREQQLERAFSASVSRELLLRLAGDARASALLPELESAVRSGKMLPTAAARELASAIFGPAR